MPANYNDYRTLLTYDRRTQITNTTYAMSALNTGWCARITAVNSKKPATVYVNWSTVSGAGTVTLRIETIDATTGKPTGTLYDANATKAFTPAAGWQAVTFSPAVSAGFTAGTEYGVVMLTTTAGTTHTLRSATNLGSYPTCVLTAADGTTRANFAEASQPCPIMTLVYDDGEEDPLQCCQYATASNWNVFGTTGYGALISLDCTTDSDGVEAFLIKTGTPAGDLRVRVLDSSNAVVGTATHVTARGSLSALSSSVNCSIPFDGLTTFAPGTYRIVFDSASSANSSNCWRIRSAAGRVAALVPTSGILTTCPDVGTPVWTDSPLELASIALRVVNRTASAGGGMLVHPGYRGGFRA